MAALPSNPPPPKSPPSHGPNPPLAGGISEPETFANPLSGSEPLTAEEQAELEKPDSLGTAMILSEAINMGVTVKWHTPLTETERAELVSDLAMVLRKHEVPNLPYHEEFKLTATMGGIVFRRVQAEAAKAEKEGQGNGHRAGSGQEGQREVGGVAQTGLRRSGSEVGDLLS